MRPGRAFPAPSPRWGDPGWPGGCGSRRGPCRLLLEYCGHRTPDSRGSIHKSGRGAAFGGQIELKGTKPLLRPPKPRVTNRGHVPSGRAEAGFFGGGRISPFSFRARHKCTFGKFRDTVGLWN